MSGRKIEFSLMDKDDETKVLLAIRSLGELIISVNEVREEMKELLTTLCEELGGDKDSTAKLKKYVRKASKAYADHKLEQMITEAEDVQSIGLKLSGN